MDKIVGEYSLLKCPHCNNLMQIFHSERNCNIYRHGVYKSNSKQIDPHLNKEECDRLSKENLIYGCGKPFKIISKHGKLEAIICKYI